MNDNTEEAKRILDAYARKTAEGRASALEVYLANQFEVYLAAGIPPSRLRLVERQGVAKDGVTFVTSWAIMPMDDESERPEDLIYRERR